MLLDDALHITAPNLRSLDGLRRIWFEPGATQQYYPLLHSVFWVQHRLWGEALMPYHVTNLLQHAGCALLVVALARRLGLVGGWWAAFCFALHPVHVESVAWIAEQKNTLSTLFLLGGAVAWLRFDTTRERVAYALATLLFLAALLSKTAVVTLPPALLVLAWWRRGRVEWQRDVVPLLPWFVAAFALGLVTLRIERALIEGVQAALPLDPMQRGLIASRALVFYAGTLVWPAELSFLYERWSIVPGEWRAWVYPVLVLGVTTVAVIAARRTRGPLAAWLLFAGTLAPVLGFFDVQWFVFAFVADHFAYVASLALLVPGAAVAARFAATVQSASGRRVSAIAAVLTVAALGAVAWRHAHRFADPITLYTHAAQQSPRSAVAHYHRALALLADPARAPEAIAPLRATLALNPAVGEAHAHLGLLLVEDPAQRNEAATHLAAALRLRPERGELQLPLADALAVDETRADEALAAYAAAIRHDPAAFAAHYNRGNLLLRLGRFEEAATDFAAAIRLRPEFAPAHSNLGLALAQTPGGLAESVRHFQSALRLDPGLDLARRNLIRVRAALEAGAVR
jgi:tetratricopeptide (TPR) repeat protein